MFFGKTNSGLLSGLILRPRHNGMCPGLLIASHVLTAAGAAAQVTVTPAPGATRLLCVGPTGTVSIDADSATTCAGTQTNITSIAVGTGASATTLSGTGVTLGSSATLAAGGNATVGGTLRVTGDTSLSTLSTGGSATLNSAAISNNATVGGTLGVAGLTTSNGIDNGGAGISNAGAITGVTGLSGDGAANISGVAEVSASGTVAGATLTDGAGTTVSGGTINTATVNATTVNATNANYANLNIQNVSATNATISDSVTAGTISDGAGTVISGGVVTTNSLHVVGNTIDNDGAINTDSLNVRAGGITVASGAPISMGGNRVQDVGTPIGRNDAANKAYVDQEIDQTAEGVAIAMAMGGLALPQGKDFALSANVGFFDDRQAVAAQAALRVNEILYFNGGAGVGLSDNKVGGRVGLMAAW